MANPPRQKGTRWETELLPILRRLFGEQVERAPLKGTLDAGDFLGVPFLVEAKSTKSPRFQEWARKCERKAGKAWSIIWTGDRRVKTGAGPYVVMPLELWEDVVGTALMYDGVGYLRVRIEGLEQ